MNLSIFDFTSLVYYYVQCVYVQSITVQLLCYFLKVKIPSCILYHYDIAIHPDKCPRRVNREIVEALVQTRMEYFGDQKPVFDGKKNLYSRKQLPGIGRERVSHYITMVTLCVTIFIKA